MALQNRSRARMRQRRWNVAGMLVAIALFLLADVSLGRLQRAIVDRTGVRATEEVAESAREYRVAHPYYSHDLIPNYQGTVSWGPIQYTMRTNSLGFRDATPREVAPRRSGTRLLLMGDSFLEGPGVDYEATVAGLLAGAFASGGIEVLNAAVVSYSPAIYWKKIEYLLDHRGLQFDAVALFLDVSDIQDEAAFYVIDEAGRVADAPSPPLDVIDVWSRYSLTYRVLARAGQALHPHPPLVGCRVASWADLTCRAGWTSSRAAMNRYGRNGLRLADERMTHLAALLRERRIPLTIVVYPWPQQLIWNDRSSLQVAYWHEWATREKVDFIELFTTFFSRADALGTAEAIERYFIESDIHWTADGHRLVAASFTRHFRPPWKSESRHPLE